MSDAGNDKVDGAPMSDDAIPVAEDSVQEGTIASPEEQIAGDTAD